MRIWAIFIVCSWTAWALPSQLLEKCHSLAIYTLKTAHEKYEHSIEAGYTDKVLVFIKNTLEKYDHVCALSRMKEMGDVEQFIYGSVWDDTLDCDKFLALIKKIENEKVISPSEFKIVENKFPLISQRNYCRREAELVDKITVHHTETPNYFSFKKLNDIFVGDSRGFGIAGYHYLMRSSYESDLSTKGADAYFIAPTIGTGRPYELVGGHNSRVVNGYNSKYVAASEVVKSLLVPSGTSWEKIRSQTSCFYKDTKNLEKKITVEKYFSDHGFITENIRSIGIGLIGSYSGSKQPTIEGINLLAKTICHIAKENPNIYFVDLHQDTQLTDCPGSIRKLYSVIAGRVTEKCFEEGLLFPYL